MLSWRRKDEWMQVLRYYAAGLVNMGFGYLMFAALVALGLRVFVAQAVAFALGVAFNYITHSQFAFKGQKANKKFYLGSYGVSYLLSAGFLWIVIAIVPSPYVAGLIVTVLVSIINYVFLKRLVFQKAKSAP